MLAASFLWLVACSGARTGLDFGDGGAAQDADANDGGEPGDAGTGCEDVCRCPVAVPEGVFTMGVEWEFDCSKSSPCDWDPVCTCEPPHEVYESAYSINRFEATVGCYGECVRSGECPDLSDREYPPPSFWSDAAHAIRPAFRLPPDAAEAYCRRLGGRLPTEAEWEKAARGTDQRWFPWGNELPTCEDADMGRGGHYLSPCPDEGDPTLPLPVTSRPRDESPWGVRGMAGGVMEWVSDIYDPDYYSTSKAWRDPTGPERCDCDECTDGIMRGSEFTGLVGSNARHETSFLRIPAYWGGTKVGVRCVWDP